MRSSTCNKWLGRCASLLMAFVISSTLVFAQTKTVTGTIVDDLGEPMIGVNVVVVGTTNGATTDIDGNFSIQNVDENATLKVTFIGYTEQLVKVAGKSTFNLTLAEDHSDLDEVVVIGYGTVKRRDLTGSVASVSGDKLAANPVSNVAQALAGQLPGVQVVSQDGRPGASMSIRVRGGNSITQSNDPLFIVDGVQVSSIDDIPADNIESMDVLKDAASTAIYGARGANGVILITTKGGKEGKAQVKYGMYYQTKTAANQLDVMGAQDYVYYNWAYGTDLGSFGDPVARYFGLGSKYGNHYNEYANMGIHDYVDDIMQTGSSWNHDLSISGGSEKTKIYAGFNYNDDEGTRINTDFRRISANFKLDQKINKKLSADFDIRYNEVKWQGTSWDVATSANQFRPIDNPLGDGDGNTGMGNANVNFDESYNPLDRINNYESITRTQRLRGRMGLSWEIIKGLKFRSEASVGRYWRQRRVWTGADYPSEPYSKTDFTQTDGYEFRLSNTLNYEVQGIGKDHSLSFLLGQENNSSNSDASNIKGAGYPNGFTMDDAFGQISMTSQPADTKFSNTIGTASHTLSFFGRANYSYKGRYLATVTFRADGSSKFAPNNHWGYFPAAAFGWRISDESWMESTQNWLDNLKLRLSYGTSGADNINPSLWRETWQASTATVDGKVLTTYVPGDMLGNPDLKWETTTSRNLGFDFAVLKSRIRGSLEFYWNSTEDILMKVPTDPTSGYMYQMQNVAETSNKGIELSLGADLVRTKDFNLSINATYNFNSNNIEKINADVNASAHTGWGSSMRLPNYDYIVEVGRPVGVIQGFRSAGFYTVDDFNYDAATKTYTLKAGIPDQGLVNYGGQVGKLANKENLINGKAQNAFPGAVKFEDVNGDGVVDLNDCVVLAETSPKHSGGFTFNGSYKAFDFSASFTYQIGGYVYNANAMWSMMGNKDNSLGKNRLALIADTYKNYGIDNNGDIYLVTDPSELSSLNKGAKYGSAMYEYGVVSSEFIEDASFLRLNTLTFGYTLPAKLTKKAGISNARVYVTGGNLFCLNGYSGMDPEVNTNADAGGDGFPTPNYDYNAYPKARTFTFGLNVSF